MITTGCMMDVVRFVLWLVARALRRRAALAGSSDSPSSARSQPWRPPSPRSSQLAIGLRTLYAKLKRHADAGPANYDASFTVGAGVARGVAR